MLQQFRARGAGGQRWCRCTGGIEGRARCERREALLRRRAAESGWAGPGKAIPTCAVLWQALMQKGAEDCEQEERSAACQRCACCVQEGLRRARAES